MLPVTVTVVNASGKVYRNLSLKGEGSNVLQLSLKDFSAGLYLVIARQGNKRASTKLIVNENAK